MTKEEIIKWLRSEEPLKNFRYAHKVEAQEWAEFFARELEKK